MDAFEIKQYLNNDPEKLIDVLESIGCHHIKLVENKRVVCSLPDGDNGQSVQVLLCENLTTKIWTRPDYEVKFSKRDFFTLIQYIKECNFATALKIVCDICDIKVSLKSSIKSDAFDFLKDYKKSLNKTSRKYEYSPKIIDESLAEQFVDAPHKLFLDDGISIYSQYKYEVKYDLFNNRVVFPIRNDEGKLLSFKGRTCDPKFKEKGISKYLYYYPVEGMYLLYGLNLNMFDILTKGEAIVFEAEKSCMQCDTFDVVNTLACSKKILSDYQVNKLIQLKVDITLAFDKGVDLNDILIECRKFKGLCNVYYIYDVDNLLEDKMSPSDAGFEVFNKLYTDYRFKFKE